MSAFQLHGRTALVTGASSGIGWALAHAMAREGTALVLTARRTERLTALQGEIAACGLGEPRIVAGDLAAPGGPDAVFAAAEEASGGCIDILINNAGFGGIGAVAGADLNRLSAMLRVNIEALVRLTRLALPGMIARGEGVILQVASTAAFVPLPCSAVYAATKAFVVNFSEAVHAEAKAHGVRVVCLCPGRTATEFFAVAGYGPTQPVMRGMGWMTAESVAAAGLSALKAGHPLRGAGLLNDIAVRLLPLVPRSVLRAGAQRMMQARIRAALGADTAPAAHG